MREIRSRALLLGATALMAAGGASCGETPAPSGIPPACELLSDADIRAAVHLQPSGEGGAFTESGSTCVWALPNAANGSISVIEVSCGTACEAPRASLAPSPAFAQAGDAAGPGVTAWLGADAIVVEVGGSVVKIVAAQTDTGAASLESLARSAIAHLG
jgi:hypothetical protein